MAVTITLYNGAADKILGQEVTISTLKVALLGNTATSGFDASHTTLAQVLGSPSDEVSGNGWTSGGETIANVAVTTVTTNDAKLDGDDLSVTATGGDIGPAYGAVIYDDTDASDGPLALIDFGEAKTAGVGTDFKITWNASGIITATVA